MEQSFLSVYLVFVLLLTIYQDFPLANMIGEIGRTPIVLLFPVFVFCEIALLAKHKKITNGSKLQSYIFFFILYLSFVSLLYIFIQYMHGVYGFGSEGLLGKAVKVIIYFVLILLYIRHMQLIFTKISSYRAICACFIAIVSVLMGIMIIEMMSMPHALPFLHSGDDPYWRVRLLTSESSTTGSIVVVYTAIMIYLTRYLGSFARKLVVLYGAGFFIFYLLETGSKGFMVVILLTLVVTMFKFLDFRKKRNFFLLLGMLLLLYLFIANFSAVVLGSFNNDIENYTSSYTRMGTILIAVFTVLHHPLGVGTGAYLVYFNTYMADSVSFMSNFYYKLFGVSQINVSELMKYSDSTKNLGVKSGFFQWVMFGGLFSLLFFFLIAKNLIIKARVSLILFLALVFILFSLLLVSLEIKYEIWLLFAFISLFLGKKEIGPIQKGEVTS